MATETNQTAVVFDELADRDLHSDWLTGWARQTADRYFQALMPCDLRVRTNKNSKVIELDSEDARDYIKQLTGQTYRTIILQDDDPRWTALLLRFDEDRIVYI